MKPLALLLLSWMLMYPVFGQDRSLEISAGDIALEKADLIDITAPGKWFVQLKQDDWVKSGKTLYPDKSKRTRAVSDAQNAFKNESDSYIIAALNAGKCEARETGTGLMLSAREVFNSRIAIKFEDGISWILYIRENNKQYILSLFENLADETAAATTARANMVRELAKISTAADAGGFIK